jgi:hypothetical protein
LAIAISDKLNVRFDDFGEKLVSGDLDLFRNVSSGRDATVTQKAAWLIRDGIILANSIDDFLDVHQHDEEVVRYGKAAIVKCILEAERSSKIELRSIPTGGLDQLQGLCRYVASKIDAPS